MCIAIVKPQDKVLDEDTLRTCFNNNSDGAGFAYAENGQLVINKGYFSFEEFWTDFSAVQEGVPMLVHFRIQTSGNKDDVNCHPWKITDDICLIHNGVISDLSFSDSPISDTGLFAERALRPLVEIGGYKVLEQDFSEYFILNALGSSKMATLDKDGNYLIFNKDLGEEDDGIWYSNTSYISKKSKQNKTEHYTVPAATNSETKHLIFKKNKKYGVFKVGGSMRPLSNKEVHEIRVEYKSKVKKLINKGILSLIEIGPDTDESLEYAARLEQMAAHSAR